MNEYPISPCGLGTLAGATPPQDIEKLQKALEGLRRLAAKQREQRGDMMDYGSPDPEIVSAIAAIEVLASKPLPPIREVRRPHVLENGFVSPPPADDDGVDSGLGGPAVERAEWFWAQLPTRRLWTSLTTAEKALVCHQLARAVQSPPPIMGEGHYRARKLHPDVRPGFNAVVDDPSGWPICHCADLVEAEKITTALNATPSLPEGMVMVPRGPTEEMLRAGRREGCEVRLIYRAMIATAPASALRMDKGVES